MTERRKILWTENSIQDLLAIKEFISQDSPERAESWVFGLFEAGENLAELPTRGRIVPEFNRDELRELLIENYRLVYRVKPSLVEILTVFEGHRRLSKKDIKK